MWQADGPVEIAALGSGCLINLDRLAEDLQIFATAEFGLVELAERHTRPSVIMPQKKNPYALAYLRGLAGEAIGTLAAMAAVGKTPSGQIDNRMFAYGDVPRLLDRVTGGVRLMADVLAGLKVDADRGAERAGDDFMGATDLAEVIMLECGLDYRTAHAVVATAVREAVSQGVGTLDTERLDTAAQEILGRRLGLKSETVAAALEPDRIVSTRSGRGGAAPGAVDEMIAECRATLEEHREWRGARESHLAEAHRRLMTMASERRTHLPERGDPRADGSKGAGEGTPPESSDARSWEQAFADLPKPPRRRRWGFPRE
jgi:argininosuccinate lyase